MPDEPALPEKPYKTFRTKVAGVTHRNKDRTSRQATLRKMKKALDNDELFDLITLVREPDNPHDPNAIKVINEEGKQIGYIRSAVAYSLAQNMDNGTRVVASVVDIVGGEEDLPTLGCVIEISLYHS
jgi:hypothetical protein